MMDRKPWQDKGLRRSFDGDEGGERRRFGRFDRFASSVIARVATLVTVSLLATVRVLIALTARIAATALTALNGATSAIVLAAILATVRVLTTRSLSAIALTDRVRISALVRDRAPVPTIRAALPNALNLPAMPWSRLIRTSPISLAAPKQSTRLCAS